MITLNVRNPIDGTSSFNQIKIYRATSQTGTFTLLTTVTIDLTGATEFSTGFTSYNDSTGDTTYWYEFSYYNSGSSTETALSTAIQGGTAYLDTRIRDELQDNNSADPNYPFWTNTQVANARQDAVNSLYPEYFKDWIDKSLTTTQFNWEYSIPAGMYDIEKVEIWDQTQTPYVKIDEWDDFDIVDNKIRLLLTSQVNTNTGYTMYIYGKRMISDSADAPAYMDELLIAKSCAVLLRQLLWDRAKYQRYTTIIRPEGSNMPSIMQMIKYYETLAMGRRNEIKKGVPARDMVLV